ncbi:MAG: hypothetical protein L0922_07300 [Candidatus Mariimomonas ferrooxydans]
MVQELTGKYQGEKTLIIFDTEDTPEELQKKGFHRVLINGKIKDISSLVTRHSSLNVVLDRLVIKDEPRLSDSIETAWEHGNGEVRIEFVDALSEKKRSLIFAMELKCLKCNIEIAKSQPLLFSLTIRLALALSAKALAIRLNTQKTVLFLIRTCLWKKVQ